eukprot:3306619-Alexandrium_andersonii.AAC.1
MSHSSGLTHEFIGLATQRSLRGHHFLAELHDEQFMITGGLFVRCSCPDARSRLSSLHFLAELSF